MVNMVKFVKILLKVLLRTVERAYSSARLERGFDKPEVGGSNPPRSISIKRGKMGRRVLPTPHDVSHPRGM